jgi:hypothetical protein
MTIQTGRTLGQSKRCRRIVPKDQPGRTQPLPQKGERQMTTNAWCTIGKRKQMNEKAGGRRRMAEQSRAGIEAIEGHFILLGARREESSVVTYRLGL